MLSDVIRGVNVGDIFKVRIKVNNKVVDNRSYDDTVFGLDRTRQKVVAKDILKAGENAVLFEVQNEVDPGGKVTFSDVVLAFQVSV